MMARILICSETSPQKGDAELNESLQLDFCTVGSSRVTVIVGTG